MKDEVGRGRNQERRCERGVVKKSKEIMRNKEVEEDAERAE